MKRWIASVLTACFLLPGAAMAEGVLADGWQEASLDALLDAKATMNQQITKLITRQEVPSEGVTLSGEGLSVTDGYTLPAGLWRRIIKIPNMKSYEDQVTFTKGGSNDTITISDATTATPLQSSSATEVDYAVVETGGAWSITYEPIGTDGTISVSGNGGMVSDSFTCTKPTVVLIEAKSRHPSSSYFGVRLYTISKSGTLCSKYGSELMASEGLESGDSISVKAIIKPDDSYIAYLWVVETDDGVEWSITAK